MWRLSRRRDPGPQEILWNSEGYFRTASDFPWTVPLGHAFLCWCSGVVVVVLGRHWPRLFSLRTATWLFATLAIWMALLRMPLYGACSLLLAAGLGRVIADAVAAHELLAPARQAIDFRGARGSAGSAGGLVVGLAGDS